MSELSDKLSILNSQLDVYKEDLDTLIVEEILLEYLPPSVEMPEGAELDPATKRAAFISGRAIKPRLARIKKFEVSPGGYENIPGKKRGIFSRGPRFLRKRVVFKKGQTAPFRNDPILKEKVYHALADLFEGIQHSALKKYFTPIGWKELENAVQDVKNSDFYKTVTPAEHEGLALYMTVGMFHGVGK